MNHAWGALVWLMAGLPPAEPTEAVSTQLSPACAGAIQQAVATIQSRPSATVSFQQLDELAIDYQRYPLKRPLGFNLRLAGQGAGLVMEDDGLLQELSAEILQGCSAIGRVRFTLDQTDWDKVFGWQRDRVKAFRCLRPAPNVAPRWGEYICV